MSKVQCIVSELSGNPICGIVSENLEGGFEIENPVYLSNTRDGMLMIPVLAEFTEHTTLKISKDYIGTLGAVNIVDAREHVVNKYLEFFPPQSQDEDVSSSEDV